MKRRDYKPDHKRDYTLPYKALYYALYNEDGDMCCRAKDEIAAQGALNARKNGTAQAKIKKEIAAAKLSGTEKELYERYHQEIVIENAGLYSVEQTIQQACATYNELSEPVAEGLHKYAADLLAKDLQINAVQVYVASKGKPVEVAQKVKDATQVRVFTNIDGQPVLELTLPGNVRRAFDLRRYDFWILPQESETE